MYLLCVLDHFSIIILKSAAQRELIWLHVCVLDGEWNRVSNLVFYAHVQYIRVTGNRVFATTVRALVVVSIDDRVSHQLQ